MCPNALIHSPAEEYVDCFQFETTMNKAATNIHTHVFMLTQIFISLGQRLEKVGAGLCGK